MWRAIEDAAIFDEDEDDKDDNSEDNSISEIRRDAGGKTKKSVPRKKTNSSSLAWPDLLRTGAYRLEIIISNR